MAGILAWETRGPVLTPTCCVASAGFHPFSGPVSLMSQGMVFLDMVTLCGGVSLSLSKSWGSWRDPHLFCHGLTPEDTPRLTPSPSLFQWYCWTLLQLEGSLAGSHTRMAKGYVSLRGGEGCGNGAAGPL